MKNGTRDMTVGNPTGLILRFSLPILAGNALQQLYSLVDSLIVGRMLGVTALTAVSASGWLDWTVLSLAMGLAQGFSIRAAQEYGAKDYAGLRRTVGQSALIAVIVTVLLGLVSQLLLRPTLLLMRTKTEIIDLTEGYLRIIFAGLPLTMALNVLAGFLRALGNSRTPLVAMVCSTTVNILLDVLFIGPLQMHVNGGALATVSAQAVSVLICAVAFRRTQALCPGKEDLRPDRPKCRQLLRLGSPVAFQNLVISIGGLILQTVVNGFSYAFVAGYNAASRLQGLVEIAGASLGGGVSTFAGQNRGAGRLDRVRQGLRKSAFIGFVMGAAVGAAVALAGRPLLSMFITADESAPPDFIPQVMTIGYRFLCVMSGGLPMLYLLFVYRSTLQGLGNTVVPMISGFVELAMRVGAALLLPLLMAEWGVCFAEILAWIGAAILLMVGYYREIGKLEQTPALES